MITEPHNSNRLLSRQLKKAFPDKECTMDQFHYFIEMVNKTYQDYEAERMLYSRAEAIANNELEKINEELQQKNDFLDTFNHGMAHDIKNHTSNIIGLINMLKKYTDKKNLDMIQQISERLDTSANQLTSIVQGFLYLSRAESKIDNQYKIIEKQELIDLVTLETQFLTKGKSVSIKYDFNLHELYYSRHVLKIILVNLISNSIKYSQPNKPCVVNAVLNNDNEFVYISVTDNGIGMDLENSHKKLYNLFNQMHQSDSKGFGVGLFLIKKMLERNKGTINIQSQLNVGTSIEIKLPLTH